MTKDDNVQQQQPQQQQNSFHIILIDIHATAEEKVIRCVEKPLYGDGDTLKFVALSYRWGELNQSFVDTQMGYRAMVTSFSLEDFYLLCKTMTKEVDLQSIPYVWVDAICVDQSNHERRKETIHQMSNIYERATYIVAVPDLQLEYLRMTTYRNQNNIHRTIWFGQYLYHLLHGNKELLDQMDETWLNKVKLDSDWKMNGVTGAEAIRESMEFLRDLVKEWSARVWVISEYSIAKKRQKMKYWFIQLQEEQQPLYQQQMKFFSNTTAINNHHQHSFRFFEYDFHSGSNPSKLNFKNLSTGSPLSRKLITSSYVGYSLFHTNMNFLLDKQTFLETILRSKASRDEDRFNAVLPLSKYKHIIKNKDVVTSWNIKNLISVKLRLFEFMDTNDKLELLFWSGYNDSLARADILPTFATSNIIWTKYTNHLAFDDIKEGCNFDHANNNNSTIMLMPIHCDDDNDTLSQYYKLNLKPMQYYVYMGDRAEFMLSEFRKKTKQQPALYKQRLDLDDTCPLHIVCIPSRDNATVLRYLESYEKTFIAMYIFLIGSFETNTWILQKHPRDTTHINEIDYQLFDNNDIAFDIY